MALADRTRQSGDAARGGQSSFCFLMAPIRRH